MRAYIIALTLLISSLFAAPASSQTGSCPVTTGLTTNPSGWVAIPPGPDYTLTHADPSGGTTPLPNVVRMDLLLFGPSVTDTATGAQTQTINIGKPAVNAQGCVWVHVPAITAIPVGQQYKARVVSIGQPNAAGVAQVSGRSPESNPFIRLAPSPAPLAPLGVSVPAS